MRLPVDFEYLTQRFKEENVTQKDVSKLLGKSETYIAYCKSKGTGLTNEDIRKLKDLMDIDMKKLVPRNAEAVVEPDEAIDALFKEIGILRNEIAILKKKMEEPQIVAIPMNAKDMAVLVLEDLLACGWCTKDDVLVKFNEKHIPTEYISHAIKENGAVAATTGVAHNVRTYYIKEE